MRGAEDSVIERIRFGGMRQIEELTIDSGCGRRGRTSPVSGAHKLSTSLEQHARGWARPVRYLLTGRLLSVGCCRATLGAPLSRRARVVG
jgi:hypothetical protein